LSDTWPTGVLCTYWKQFGNGVTVYPFLLIPGRLFVGLGVIGGILALRLRELVVFCLEPRYEVKYSLWGVSSVGLFFVYEEEDSHVDRIREFMFICVCVFVDVCLFTRIVKWWICGYSHSRLWLNIAGCFFTTILWACVAAYDCVCVLLCFCLHNVHILSSCLVITCLC